MSKTGDLKCWTRRKKNGGTYTHCEGKSSKTDKKSKTPTPPTKQLSVNPNLTLPKRKRGRPKKELTDLLSRYTKQTSREVEQLPEWLLPEDLPIISDSPITEKEEEWKIEYEDGTTATLKRFVLRFGDILPTGTTGEGWFESSDGDIYDSFPDTDDFQELGERHSDGTLELYDSEEEDEEEDEDEVEEEEPQLDYSKMTKEQMNRLDPSVLFGLLPVELRKKILTPSETGTKVGSNRDRLIEAGYKDGGFITIYSTTQEGDYEQEWRWYITLNRKRVKLEWNWRSQSEEEKDSYQEWFYHSIWGSRNADYYPQSQTISVPYANLQIIDLPKEKSGIALGNDYNKYVDKGKLMGKAYTLYGNYYGDYEVKTAKGISRF
tara:strand:+ start:1504 stop:2634 length:1131 start_codon:yes stop_codon:yes gene_type:complete